MGSSLCRSTAAVSREKRRTQAVQVSCVRLTFQLDEGAHVMLQVSRRGLLPLLRLCTQANFIAHLQTILEHPDEEEEKHQPKQEEDCPTSATSEDEAVHQDEDEEQESTASSEDEEQAELNAIARVE